MNQPATPSGDQPRVDRKPPARSSGSSQKAESHFTRILRWLGWPVRMLLQGLILGYQKYVSPLFASSCRYYPSCSGYALLAVRRHGAFKGTLLSVLRILRCNPWSKGGVDPVPRRGQWVPDVFPDGSARDRTDIPSGQATKIGKD